MESHVTRADRYLNATGDWVFFTRVKDEIVSPGGIVIAGQDTNGNQSGSDEGVVVAVGPKAESCEVGDRIKFVGRAVGFQCDGEVYFMARDTTPKPGDMQNDPQGNPIGPPFICCRLIPRAKADA